MKEWVPLNAYGTWWRYGEHDIYQLQSDDKHPWHVWRGNSWLSLWTDPYMAGAAKVAEALEQLAADGARITTT